MAIISNATLAERRAIARCEQEQGECPCAKHKGYPDPMIRACAERLERAKRQGGPFIYDMD